MSDEHAPRLRPTPLGTTKSVQFINTLPIRMAILELRDLEVTPAETAFAALAAHARERHDDAVGRGDTAPGSVGGIQMARGLFRQLGIDPTKHRPSSEALLRRALKQKELPRVNTLVDVGNWWSLEFLLPLGLYDLDHIEGTVTLREGRDEEVYDALNGRTLNLAGRYVLADEAGPFGTPITDSCRTRISEETRRAAFFVYAPCAEPATFAEDVDLLGARTVAHCGGSVVACAIHTT